MRLFKDDELPANDFNRWLAQMDEHHRIRWPGAADLLGVHPDTVRRMRIGRLRPSTTMRLLMGALLEGYRPAAWRSQKKTPQVWNPAGINQPRTGSPE